MFEPHQEPVRDRLPLRPRQVRHGPGKEIVNGIPDRAGPGPVIPVQPRVRRPYSGQEPVRRVPGDPQPLARGRGPLPRIEAAPEQPPVPGHPDQGQRGPAVIRGNRDLVTEPHRDRCGLLMVGGAHQDEAAQPPHLVRARHLDPGRRVGGHVSGNQPVGYLRTHPGLRGEGPDPVLQAAIKGLLEERLIDRLGAGPQQMGERDLREKSEHQGPSGVSWAGPSRRIASRTPGA